MQDQLPDGQAGRRTTRLPGYQGPQPTFLQVGVDPLGLGRFSGPVNAFEGYE